MERTREPLPTRVGDTPDLPPGYDAALHAALERLGLVLSDPAGAAIDGHLRLLLAWTVAINLTAVRDPVAAATAHVADSLSAVRLLRDLGITWFLDLGSGGGLPGIPLAAALPADSALLVEPIAKKARFLTTAIAAIGLSDRVGVAVARGESLAREPAHRGRWPAVTARAVAATAELVELAFPLLADGGRLVAWKGAGVDDELDAARRAMGALGGGRIEVHAVDVPGLEAHRLVVATRTGQVPEAFPRDPAVRRRRPW